VIAGFSGDNLPNNFTTQRGHVHKKPTRSDLSLFTCEVQILPVKHLSQIESNFWSFFWVPRPASKFIRIPQSLKLMVV